MDIQRFIGDVWDLTFELENIPDGVDVTAYSVQYGLKKNKNDDEFLTGFPISGSVDDSVSGVIKLTATVSETLSDTVEKGKYWEGFLVELSGAGEVIDRKTLGLRSVDVSSKYFT
jgi:hypothetical protein